MTSKKYVAWLVFVQVSLMAVNLIFWHGYAKKFLTQKDLAGTGYFLVNEFLTPDKKFPGHHVELANYLKSGKKESFDIITIGDSFSNGCAKAYYQDILVSRYGLKILNVRFRIDSCLRDLYYLIQSGLLEEFQPRLIILERVGRAVHWSLGSREISSKNVPNTPIEKFFAPKPAAKPKRTLGIFSSIMFQYNWEVFKNLFYRRIHRENLSPKVFFAELDRDLFTNKNQENLLLYYFEDFNFLKTPANIAMINKNLNNVAGILAEKNIKLAFMPCVDKFDLYYPYIKDKHGRPENNLFEEIRKIPDKKYIFIDTKKILREALALGEKDIYWIDDTHWSWRGMSIVCEKIFEAICENFRIKAKFL